jgi:hypothetical protein
MFGIEDVEGKIVAVLHHVVEDSKPPYRWGLQELEAEGFSANVIEALDCVTKRPDEPYEVFIKRIPSEPDRRPSKICRSPGQYELGQTRSRNHREGCCQAPKVSTCVGPTNKAATIY